MSIVQTDLPNPLGARQNLSTDTLSGCFQKTKGSRGHRDLGANNCVCGPGLLILYSPSNCYTVFFSSLIRPVTCQTTTFDLIPAASCPHEAPSEALAVVVLDLFRRTSCE